MILIDYSQVAISAITAITYSSKQDADIDFCRHVILNTIRSIRKQFGAEYGEIIICCDSGNYWRKDNFPHYKITRKNKDGSVDPTMAAIFKGMNTVKYELMEYFPYKVLQVPRCEADDIISTLCKYTQENELMPSGVFDDVQQKVLIVSSDHDFGQLQIFPNVSQYSPRKKVFLKEHSPRILLWEHILRGDSGDAVPNFRCDDDIYIDNTKARPCIMSDAISHWLNVILTDETKLVDVLAEYEYVKRKKDFSSLEVAKEHVIRNIERNRKLVDLVNGIPIEYQDKILECYNTVQVSDGKNLTKFFMDNKLRVLSENIQDFTQKLH